MVPRKSKPPSRSHLIVNEILGAIVAVLAPPFVLLNWLLSPTFGRAANRKLVTDVETAFSYLLSLHEGTVNSPRKRSRYSSGYAEAIVQFKEIRFRIVRGMGEVGVQVAPPRDSERWRDLEGVWSVVAPNGLTATPLPNASLVQMALFMQEHWDALVAAMSSNLNYSETMEAVR